MAYLDPIAGKRREKAGLTNAGAPSAGTSEVQTISSTGTPTGGTFKLKFLNRTTAAIAYNASAATIVAALEALSTIGTGGVTATGGALPTDVVVTFAAQLGKKAVPTMTVVASALAGGTNPAITVAKTTTGVDATGRGAAKGMPLYDITNGLAYINTGTANAPTWTKIGVQT